MLLLGRQRQRTCRGLTRRAFLQVGASTVLGLSLADLLRWAGCRGDLVAGSAKSVMLLWLWGGPAQLDTWDPKPDAPLEFRGPFGTIATRSARRPLRRTVPADRPPRPTSSPSSARCTPAPTTTASPAPSA